jgi:hypothetical protein
LLADLVEVFGEIAGFHWLRVLPGGRSWLARRWSVATGAKANRCAGFGYDTSRWAVFVHSGECIIQRMTRLVSGEWNARTSPTIGHGCQPGGFPLRRAD